MTDHELHPDDAALLDRLHDIADIVDPVPYHVVELGKASFALRRIDAELMSLVEVPVQEGAVRAVTASSRIHFFEHGSVFIDVEVTRRGDFAQVVGVVTDMGDPEPPHSRIVLETASSSVTVDLHQGRFTIERVPLGLVRLVLERAGERSGERAGERALTTGWFDAG